ncbi:hypothetical protein [Streptosporangium sp. NPDC000396]|uniref:hypothetical protein n=1 Tax=Streptosporangium sp. NPDC000396 TaxID=3366185 RepID=UPI0036CE8FE5
MAGLKTDLELARQEIAALRGERNKLKEALRRQLGQQLDRLASRRRHELAKHETPRSLDPLKRGSRPRKSRRDILADLLLTCDGMPQR